MGDSDSDSLQEMSSSKYEIPEEVNESVLMTLGRNVEMKTFTRNTVRDKQYLEVRRPNDDQNDVIVAMCVGATTGKDNVFIKDHFHCTLPEGSYSPSLYMDIHLKKMKSLPVLVNALSVSGPDPEGYARFNFESCHGALVFWVPAYPCSLTEAAKWTKTIGEFANSRVPCVLMSFTSTDWEWMGTGKAIDTMD